MSVLAVLLVLVLAPVLATSRHPEGDAPADGAKALHNWGMKEPSGCKHMVGYLFFLPLLLPSLLLFFLLLNVLLVHQHLLQHRLHHLLK